MEGKEARNPEEIMAECLLKGGKMLARTCSACGAPLFEYRGETLCVVCHPPATRGEKPAPGTGGAPASTAEKAVTPASPAPYAEAVVEELCSTLISLCQRVREEPDAGQCRALMQCISEGAETLIRLRRQ